MFGRTVTVSEVLYILGGIKVEKVQVSEEMKQNLTAGFKKMKRNGIVFLTIGVVWTISWLIGSLISNNPIFITGTPFSVFIIIGILFMGQAENCIKKINNDDFQVFKTKCIRKRMFGEYAIVENNETLSKKVRKPTKWVLIIGPVRSVQAGDEIGVFKADKALFALSLKS